MRRLTVFSHLLLAFVCVACDSDTPSSNSSDTEQRVSAILYSNLKVDEMAQALEPFVKPADHFEEFKRKGFSHFVCQVTPHNNDLTCTGVVSGLSVVFDSNARLRKIIRQARAVNGQEYSELVIFGATENVYREKSNGG